MVKNTNYSIVSGGNRVKVPKQCYPSCLKTGKPYNVLLYAGIVSLIAVVLIFFVGIPFWMRHMIRSQIQLRKGTLAWDMWQEVPVPILIKCWAFNITNPNALQDGEKFRLEELGPYTFEEKRTRIVVDSNEEEDTVTYNETVHYYFRRDLSNGSLDDAFTVANPLYISVATLGRQYLHGLGDALVRTAESLGETFTVKNVTMREMMFDGYKANSFYKPLINIGPGDDITEFHENKFGYLLNINGSMQGQSKIRAGVKDSSAFGKIVTFNGMKELHYWTDPKRPPNQQYCNKINGSDGTANRPLITKDRKIYVFHPYICRSIHFVYNKEVELFGIKTFQIKFPKDFFAGPEKNPDNACFCLQTNESSEDRCVDGGFYVGRCKKEARIVITRPHFWEADPRFLDGVEGLNPSETKHDTEIYIEPLTGVPIKASVKVQINIEIKPIPGMPSFTNIKHTMLPLFWVEVAAELREKDINLMKDMFVNKEANLQIAKWAVTGFNLIFVFITFCMVLRRRTITSQKEQQAIATVTEAFVKPVE